MSAPSNSDSLGAVPPLPWDSSSTLHRPRSSRGPVAPTDSSSALHPWALFWDARRVACRSCTRGRAKSGFRRASEHMLCDGHRGWALPARAPPCPSMAFPALPSSSANSSCGIAASRVEVSPERSACWPTRHPPGSLAPTPEPTSGTLDPYILRGWSAAARAPDVVGCCRTASAEFTHVIDTTWPRYPICMHSTSDLR